MPDLISVLIPAYNHERYVEQTIRSLLEQTYPSLELIIVDDGSPDGTWERMNTLLAECRQRFVRVIFERQTNQGLCLTVRRLLELMQGEYAYMIASDDLAKPQALETLHRFLSQNVDYALAVGDNELIDQDSRRIYWDRLRRVVHQEEAAVYATFGEYLRDTRRDVDFLSEDFGGYPSLLNGNYIPNGLLIRKCAFESGWVYTLEAPLEDWHMALQVSKRYKMKYINKVLFSYRWHDSNNVKMSGKMRAACLKTFWHEVETVRWSDDDRTKRIVNRYLYWSDTPGPFAIGLLAARCWRRVLRMRALAAHVQDHVRGLRSL